MTKEKGQGKGTGKSPSPIENSPLHALTRDPIAAAVASKATTNPRPNGIDIATRAGGFSINQSGMYEIAAQVGQNRRDGENILQLFPDIELAMQVLVSSTLSPKDMKQVEVIFGNEDNGIIPANVTANLTALVKNEIEKNYKLSEEQDRILREALFTAGAHVRVIIPESSLDDMVHGRDLDTKKLSVTFESDASGSIDLRRSKGLGALASNECVVSDLQKTTTLLERLQRRNISTENVNPNALTYRFKDEVVTDPLIEFTDNIDTLKLPQIAKALIDKKMREAYRGQRRLAAESVLARKQKDGLVVSQESSVVARRAQDTSTNMSIARLRDSATRRAIGRPLELEVPPESMMVIHTPGRPSDHRAYIMLVDIDGNPVDMSKSIGGIGGTAMQNFASSLGDSVSNPVNLNGQGPSGGSSILEHARQHLKNRTKEDVVHVPDLMALFGSILEDNIARRINAGMTAGDIEMSEQNEFYRLMFARALAGRYTRMVFIPKELVSYYAFNYYDNGVGCSYFENVKVLCMHRAAMLYSDVIGHVKSTIPITRVNIKLSEDDVDPYATIAMAISEIMQTRNDILPNRLSPAEMNTWAIRQGMEFNFEDHPRLPDTRLDFETKRLERSSSDDTISENLRKQTIMAFGLNPDQVDAGMQVEFATSLQQSNLLLSKHTARIGAKLSAHNTHYVKSILENDMVIREQLAEVIVDNIAVIREYHAKMSESNEFTGMSDAEFVEEILDTYISTIKLSLPQPDSNSVDVLTERFEAQLEAYKKAIDQFLGSDFITADVAGEAAGSIDILKQVLLSELMRKWMADNGYLSEVSELFSTDETNTLRQDHLSSSSAHIKTAVKMLLKFVESMKTFKEAADKDVETVGLTGGSYSSDSSDTETTDETGTGDGGDEMGDAPPNLDDPSLDPDAGGGDEDGKDVGGEDEGDESNSKSNDFDPDSLG